MTEFIKSLSNILVIAVTILSVMAIFFEEEIGKLDVKYLLGGLALLFSLLLSH